MKKTSYNKKEIQITPKLGVVSNNLG